MPKSPPEMSILLLPPSVERQDLTLFRIYVFYRVMLSVLMVLVMVGSQPGQFVASRDLELYQMTANTYLFTNCLALLWVRRPSFTINAGQLFLVFFIDIIAITLISDASGGIISGLPTLLLVTIAASAMLLNGTIATLVAAMSALATLSDTLRLVAMQLLNIKSFLPAGLLGTLYFAISLFIQLISTRMRAAQSLAQQRTQALYDLQRLNEQVVQHMKTGILLIDSNTRVRVINPAATVLLGVNSDINMQPGRPLEDYHVELARQLARWRVEPGYSAPSFRAGNNSALLMANFAYLRGSTHEETLVFIEDYSQILAQAQQLKLASLGRLTASIAHEIRNPLSAANHATQLLGESSQLDAEDQRLTEIVLSHVKRINGIIENVLQISRREAPKPTSITMRTWIKKFMDDYRTTAPGALNVSVQCDLSFPKILFDEMHFRQILTNLLDNAIRHASGKADGTSVQLNCLPDDAVGYAAIEIVDDGDGIPLADEENIFEPFYTTVQQGSGLGLYICKDLCEINGASLDYRRGSDKLSIFSIHAPII
ncbi:MAG: two-component system sensor histidine kinase PilS (NtrC family) [Halieaceae bacterium]|jgi:two-component system sensor histidine kinase PilS (NtrC family)